MKDKYIMQFNSFLNSMLWMNAKQPLIYTNHSKYYV